MEFFVGLFGDKDLSMNINYELIGTGSEVFMV